MKWYQSLLLIIVLSVIGFLVYAYVFNPPILKGLKNTLICQPEWQKYLLSQLDYNDKIDKSCSDSAEVKSTGIMTCTVADHTGMVNITCLSVTLLGVMENQDLCYICKNYTNPQTTLSCNIGSITGSFTYSLETVMNMTDTFCKSLCTEHYGVETHKVVGDDCYCDWHDCGYGK